ncbi:hypothetical protein [Phaffia rhodozyma]|uniref:BAG domain-containing protein n=1 Tax=Phaffia rhodozyma TaxID=264483 RepID=A0A0F7SIN5_PHARH|nr:hypothetical protein [Phaffia rhodozyma]
MSGISHREELDNDSASTDEDASEEEFEDSEEEQDEQFDTSLAPQLRSELQPQPQPQSSQSLNQIMELEQTLQSLLTEKLPTLNRLQLEGHLTNLLLEADRVDPHGEFDEDAVREKRRELVRAVERVLGGDEDTKGNADLDAEERRAEEEENEVESELQPLTI